ncbi:glutathione S-transferase family protein [Pseudoalteromonas sp. T1lg65]|uniref:glutathione S-transferase family protein n=1 Tax=Pseudoalteromonas sp. T1lg65 TaxID=2077101 RepID=UPI003F79DA7C
MYTLHIANKNYSSWSLRPWVLMTELGIPFEEKVSPFGETSNWEAFREFSPTGLVPCLKDEDIAVWDSLAITEYLAEKHQSVWPESAVARAWARCAAAEMHSGFFALRNICPMNIAVRVKLNDTIPALEKDLNRLAELWREGLTRFGGPFLAGEQFSAVDAFFAPVAFRVRSFGLPLPKLAMEYVDKLLSLESMQHWEREALAEEWLEPSHERETTEHGELIEDLRIK